MTEGTSGVAPGSTLRGVEPGAALTKGRTNSVRAFRARRSPRFVKTSSHRAPATVPGRWREAPSAVTTSSRHEVSELSGAGRSSRRERSRREESSRQDGNRRATRSLARDASVGRARRDCDCKRKRFRRRRSHPRKELRWRETTIVVRGVRIVHGRARGVIRLQKSTSGARPFRARWGDPPSSTRRSSSNMREHRRAKKRRKLDRGGKTARSVAGMNGPPRERVSSVHSSMEVALGCSGT